MIIDFKEYGNNIFYIVSDYPQEFEPILKSQYYSLENGKYVKQFSKDSVNDFEALKKNYRLYAEEMFLQMGYYKDVLWEDGLLLFIDMIEGKEINWWLTGSCALCIRGIDVKPHDIDIMMDSKDISKLKNIFADYIIEPITSTGGWVVDYFGVIFLKARIDLAFDPAELADKPNPVDFGIYAMNNLEEVKWKGRKIKIPPLELQIEVNRRRGRNDRVEAIEKYIDELK